MNKQLKIVTAVGAFLMLGACNATSGGFNNSQMGTVIGGVAGGVVGNQFGKGSGKTAATALGAVIGAISGSSVGQSMDRPRTTVIYQQPPVTYRPQVGSGRCAGYANEGARSACNRGVAKREQENQRRMEKNAYNSGYGRNGSGTRDSFGFIR